MPDEPFPGEIIDDDDFQQLVAQICRTPGMYVKPPYFRSVLAFLSGFDTARNGGPLVGFQQWLIVRGDGGNNVSWEGLLEQQLGIETKQQDLEADRRAVTALGALLAEFISHRRRSGITRIMHDYANWLLSQSWYDGPLRSQSE